MISFFKLIRSLFSQRLHYFVAKSGGANSLLFYGAKTTPSMQIDLDFGSKDPGIGIRYHAKLEHAADDSLIFAAESTSWPANEPSANVAFDLGIGHQESQFSSIRVGSPELFAATRLLAPEVFAQSSAIHMALEPGLAVGTIGVYHFDDTSDNAGVRQHRPTVDDLKLNDDAGNLAAVLYRLQQYHSEHYPTIMETIRQIAPWFGDFVLRPRKSPEEDGFDWVKLNWRHRDSDEVFGPHQLPDGALRAMALVTLLLQPTQEMPELLVIDEPELGLHPHALNVVAALLGQASVNCQILVATQSPSLLDQLEPEDVVVVEREAVEPGRWESRFKQLPSEDLRDWLEEYSLGELWRKNVLGGGPL